MVKWRKVIQMVRATGERPRSKALSTELLSGLVDGRLSSADRDLVLTHLSHHTDDLVTVAAACAPPPELGEAACREAVQRATAAWGRLPIGYLGLGVAAQGLKVLRSRAAGLTPDRARLRLPKVLPAGLHLPQVCPPEAGNFLFSFADWQLALRLEAGPNGLVGRLEIPGNLSAGSEVQVDFSEDEVLLLSDALAPQATLRLPPMQVGHRYGVSFSAALRGEFTLKLEAVRFGLREQVALVLYYLAQGNVRAALEQAEWNLPAELDPRGVGRKIGDIFQTFARLFPDLRRLMAPAASRERPHTEVARSQEMEAILGHILSTQVVGSWSSKIPTTAGQREAWEAIYAELSAVAEAQPTSEQLRLVRQVLRMWLNQEGNGNFYDLALSALAVQLGGALGTAEGEHEPKG